MFFDEKLMSSESIGKVWRAAYHRNIESDSETCLPKICQELDGLIDNVSSKSRNRLSLRTSAILVDGTAKLHRQELQRLYGDVIKLNHDLIHHRKRPASDDAENITEPSNTSSSSPSPKTPEKIMRRSDKNADSLNNSINIQNSSCETEPRQRSNSGSNRQTKSGGQSTTSQPMSEDSLDLILRMPEATENNKRKTNTSKDTKNNQETQTTISVSDDGKERDGNNNLPFGFVIMFDSSGSRYPKRIICSSLKKNVESMFKA